MPSRRLQARAAPPATLEGVERDLGSGMIKGIGPIYGRKLVRARSGMTATGAGVNLTVANR